jgi:hypothetical protein
MSIEASARPILIPRRKPVCELAICELTPAVARTSIEQEGTYPLSEAQLDRFCFKVIVPYPPRETPGTDGRHSPSSSTNIYTEIEKAVYSGDKPPEAIEQLRRHLERPLSETCILVRGAGEMASGVAHRLYQSHFKICMLEIPHPLAVRREVSFCEAVFDGKDGIAIHELFIVVNHLLRRTVLALEVVPLCGIELRGCHIQGN